MPTKKLHFAAIAMTHFRQRLFCPSTRTIFFANTLLYAGTLFVVCVTALLAAPPNLSGAGGEQLSSVDRGVIEQMLKDAADAVRKEYFDPGMAGVDFNAAYAEARANIAKAGSVREGYEAVANMLRRLNDSHTFFIPPQQPFTVDQGFTMQLVGDKCFVTRVKPGSDAEAKGLKPGDQITSVDGIEPNRNRWFSLMYALNALSPRSALHLVVVSPKQQPQAMTTQSVVKNRRKTFDLTGVDVSNFIHQEDTDSEKYRSRTLVVGDVHIWKLHDFFLNEDALEGQFHKAEKGKALIIDLRGNGGGPEDVMIRMVGNLMDHDVQVAQAVRRDKTKPLIAKRRPSPFTGKLIVLVDSDSASCSEILARIVQLEKRGTVIGDLTAGAVREGHVKSFEHGQGTVYFYGVEVSVADLKMPDGHSLEGTGVTPDELLLPTAEQLANGEDPILAHALELAGASMSPKKAASLFPPLE
jgi:carboxyl-terminal processing protease